MLTIDDVTDTKRPTTLALAQLYIQEVRKITTQTERVEIDSRNAKDGFGGSEHDFCDANMPMLAAFDALSVVPFFPDDDSEPTQAHMDEMNAASALAGKMGFSK